MTEELHIAFTGIIWSASLREIVGIFMKKYLTVSMVRNAIMMIVPFFIQEEVVTLAQEAEVNLTLKIGITLTPAKIIKMK